jgi:hypothetical protein
VAPPATEWAAALVSSDDPEMVGGFTAALVASTGLTTVVPRAGGSPAERLNRAYAESGDVPWVLVASDRVRLRPGWLDQAQRVAVERGADVIGLLDVTDPGTMTGEQASTVLVRRSYVEASGASWDGPGVLAHDGYRGWPVDEIVLAARQRGVFAMAFGAVVDRVEELPMPDVKDVELLARRFRINRTAPVTMTSGSRWPPRVHEEEMES